MHRNQSFHFLLLLSILVIAFAGTPVVMARTFFVAPAEPSLSATNQILDFYAGGTSGSFSLRMSPQGGEMSIEGSNGITWTAWGYVTTQWSIGTVYIFFLANVTQNDFRIGFLYLMNSSYNQFILRVFDYQTDNINIFNFQGIQHVYNRTVSTNPTTVPHLNLNAESKIKSGIMAVGPGLYLADDGGKEVLGNVTLNIYPIYQQLFSGQSNYNELWSLLSDSSGNFYFAILYMQNSDKQHIIVEHQLRLNDYERLNGRTIEATWTTGRFPDQVIVRLPVSSNLTLDGVPFQTNSLGALTIYLPNTEVSILVPTELVAPNGSKLQFMSWGIYGSSNPLTIAPNSSLDLHAYYEAGSRLAAISVFYNQHEYEHVFGSSAGVLNIMPQNVQTSTRSVSSKLQPIQLVSQKEFLKLPAD